MRVNLGPLSERPFRLYFAGQALSLLGDAMVPITLAFAVLAITDSSPTAVGLVVLASRLPMAALVLGGGVIGDRFSRRKVMLLADAVRMVAQGATALLLVTGHAQLWHVVVLQAVNGTAAAFFTPAATGLVPQVIGQSSLQQANALLGLSRGAAAMLGQPLAAALFILVGPGGAIGIDAATFAVSGVSLALLRVPDGLPVKPRPRLLRDLVDGWGEFRRRTWLWVTVVHVSLLNMLVIAPFVVLGPVVAQRELGGPSTWAAIGTAYAAGVIAGGALSLRVKPRRPLLAAVVGVLGIVPVIALVAVAAPAWVTAPAALVAGAQGSFHQALTMTTLQAHVPAGAVSRVSSYSTLGALVLAPVGLAIAGPVAEHMGLGRTLAVSAFWALASTLLTLAVPSVRNLERPSPPLPPARQTAGPGEALRSG